MHYAANLRKSIDMLLGIAIGDAYGGPFENIPRKWINPRAIGVEKYQVNPYKGNKPGHYTDDTQMSIALAELIFMDEQFSHLNLAQHFKGAYERDKRPGYSTTTRKTLEESVDAADFLRKVNRNSERNGSAMRSVPLGIITDINRLQNHAAMNSGSTHNTPSAITASAAVALASHYFFHTTHDERKVFDFCLDNLHDFDKDSVKYLSMVSRMKQLNEHLLFGTENREYGVPIHGLRTAAAVLYILRDYGRDPSRLLKESILLGGDTDTVASISLGIAASRNGLDRLPDFLKSELENGPYGTDFLTTTAKRLATALPIPVTTYRRFNYEGSRKDMLVQGLDGLIEPIDPVYIEEIMGQLFRKVSYTKDDIIIGVDSSGYIPAQAASHVTGLPVINTKKADLDHPSKIQFLEPGTPHPDIFVYNLPEASSVIIVDDEIMTGRTVLNLAHALHDSGHSIRAAVVPIESTRYNARQKLRDAGIDLYSHTTHEVKND